MSTPPEPPLLLGPAEAGDLESPSDRRNKEAFCQSLRAFPDAGCDVLFAPTWDLTRVHFDGESAVSVARENREMFLLCRELAGRPARLAGILSPVGEQLEPFGDLPFLKLVDAYAEQSFALKSAGAALLLCHAMPELAQCRAAVIGARGAGLPVFVTVELDRDGKTPLGADPLSALLTMQGMGAAAFGFSGGPPEEIREALRILSPYAEIPLIAYIDFYGPDDAAFSGRAEACLTAGASILGCGSGCGAEQARTLRGCLDGFGFDGSFPARESEEDSITAACESESYELDAELEFTEPVRCEEDMSHMILDAESGAYDALLVRIDSAEDAVGFSRNAHMARIPVAFLSDSEEALELALAYYNGRAIVASMSELPRETLDRLARAYGAIVV